MNILYIANVRMPTSWAHGYQIMKTCEGLVHSGVKVQLVVSDRRDPLIEQDAYSYYDVSHIFQTVRLSVTDLVCQVPLFFEKAAFMFERYTFMNSLRAFLPYLLPDAPIYVRDAYLAEQLLREKKRSVYFEVHSAQDAKVLHRLSGVKGLVCLTRSLAQDIIKTLPNARVTVIPDAVDIVTFNPSATREQARAKLGLPSDVRIVTYGGNFSTYGKGKGLGLLDKAVEIVTKTHPDLRLVLVGGTAEEFERMEGVKPSSTTMCVPFGPRTDLALQYRAADVLAMPFPNTPHYANAMSPLKMFEYMASGTAIVAPDLPSVRDVLDEHLAIFHVADDVVSLADALRKAIDMGSDARSAMGAKAQELVRSKYTWDARGEAIKSFIERCETA
jgi:glycosyltransferase involved in cell wall biosynthesis